LFQHGLIGVDLLSHLHQRLSPLERNLTLVSGVLTLVGIAHVFGTTPVGLGWLTHRHPSSLTFPTHAMRSK
jgi:hypothetical protein